MTLFTVKALHKNQATRQGITNHCLLQRNISNLTTNPNPVRLTGNSLYVNSHREKSVFITGNPVLIAGILFWLQGFRCKTLYFPVWDCSAVVASIKAVL